MKRVFIFVFALCILLAAVPVSATNTPSTLQFPDVQNHWAQTTVDTMARIRVFDGYPDGNFYPERALTRAQYLASLGRAVDMGLILRYPQNPVADTFEDVKPGDWYWDDVRRALDRGWITMKDNGKELHPNDPITRKEMARIITRVTSQMTVELPENDPLLFPDVGLTHPYFSDIHTAVGAGILNGYSDGTFHPDGTLTRAEASTVILRTLQIDRAKSPYASEKFRGAWEPAKSADMFLFGGWEEAMTLNPDVLDLSALRSFASDKAINQYKAYLQYVKKLPNISPDLYGFWMGEFYPKYVNNNVAVVSWYLSFDKKVDNEWYRQKTEPFTILIKRGPNHNWVVEDFPVMLPKPDQKDMHVSPFTSGTRITFQYKDNFGTFYGFVLSKFSKNPQQNEAVTDIQSLFNYSPGTIKIKRIFGIPALESSNATLIKQLESNQTPKQAGNGLHQLVVSRTGNWFEFIEGNWDKILNQLWVNFNYNGGQYIPVSIDNISWAAMSDDPFWRKLQAYESSQKVKEDGNVLSQALETVLQKYKDK